MNTCVRHLVTILLISGAPFALANAQDRRDSGPIAVRLGASVGSLKENCENCSGAQISSFSRLALEGQLLKNLGSRGAIGIEGMLWKGTYLGLYRRAVVVSIVGSWRPAPTLGLTLEAGAGYMTFKETANGSSSELKSTGLGLQGGVAYAIPILKSISLTPFIRYLHSVGDKTTMDGSSTTGKISPKLFRCGLLLQWR